MEEFKKLIDVLERKGKSSASALINFSDGTSLETRLYQLIKNDEQANEVEIAKALYGELEINGAYKMLKSRTKKKLYNQLFFLDADNSKLLNELSSIEIKCRKLLFLADKLRRLDEISLAEQQLKKALALAEEAHLVDIQIHGLEQLKIIIAGSRFNRKDFDDCASKLEQLYHVQTLEREANSKYFDIRFDQKLGVEASHKFVEKLSTYVNDLQCLWEVSGSNLVFRRYHQLKTVYFELVDDNDSFVNYLNDIISLNASGKIHRLYFYYNYTMYLLVFAYLRAKRYKEGLLEAEKLTITLQVGSNNWFAHMENYFLLALHSKDYNKAEELLTEVLTNKYLKETTSFSQERWQLFYQFLNYITEFVCPTYPGNKFKHIPQDKKGYNMWRLILDFILILEAKQPELIEREIERLRKYSTKYLTAKEDARTKTFLKLLQVAGSEFPDNKVIKRKGAYLFNKLQQTPAPGIAYAETEIVPYEHLWELILGKMPK